MDGWCWRLWPACCVPAPLLHPVASTGGHLFVVLHSLFPRVLSCMQAVQGHIRPRNLRTQRHLSRRLHPAAWAVPLRRQLPAGHRRACSGSQRHDHSQHTGAAVEPLAAAGHAGPVMPCSAGRGTAFCPPAPVAARNAAITCQCHFIQQLPLSLFSNHLWLSLPAPALQLVKTSKP